jgi:hypothetical protein
MTNAPTMNLNTADGVSSIEISAHVKTKHGVGTVSEIDAATVWVCFLDDADGYLKPVGFPIGNPECVLTTPTAAEIEAYTTACIDTLDLATEKLNNAYGWLRH